MGWSASASMRPGRCRSRAVVGFRLGIAREHMCQQRERPPLAVVVLVAFMVRPVGFEPTASCSGGLFDGVQRIHGYTRIDVRIPVDSGRIV